LPVSRASRGAGPPEADCLLRERQSVGHGVSIGQVCSCDLVAAVWAGERQPSGPGSPAPAGPLGPAAADARAGPGLLPRPVLAERPDRGLADLGRLVGHVARPWLARGAVLRRADPV